MPLFWTARRPSYGSQLETSSHGDRRFNHMFTLGFAFYLPTEPSRSHMDEEEPSSGKAEASVKVSTK